MKAPYVSAPPGPDWSDVCYSDRAVICHERLAIVDVTHRARLVVNKGMGRVLAVNSKIDNHQEMNKERLTRHHDFQTDSDREPILYLYDELGPDFAGRQSGPTEFYAKAFEIAAPKSVG